MGEVAEQVKTRVDADGITRSTGTTGGVDKSSIAQFFPQAARHVTTGMREKIAGKAGEVSRYTGDIINSAAQVIGAGHDTGDKSVSVKREPIEKKTDEVVPVDIVSRKAKSEQPQSSETKGANKKEEKGWWASFGNTLLGAFNGGVKLVKDFGPSALESVTKVAKKLPALCDKIIPTVSEFVKDAKPLIASAARGFFRLGGDLLQWGYEFAKKALSDPQAALAAVKTGLGIGINVLGKVIGLSFAVAGVVLTGIKDGLVWCWSNTDKILPGIKAGICKGFEVLGSVLYKAGDKALGFLGAVWRNEISWKDVAVGLGGVIKSGFLLCCEMTGLSDLCRMGYSILLALDAYGKGDNKAALGHLSDALMSGVMVGTAVVISVLMTGSCGLLAPVLVPLKAGLAIGRAGCSLLMRNTIKGTVAQFMKAEGRAIGGAIVKNLSSANHEAALKGCGIKIADQMGGKLTTTATFNRLMFRHADDALRPEVVKSCGEKLATKATQNFMKKEGVEGLVTEASFNSLKELKELSKGELKDRLVKTLGLGDAEAKTAAGELKRVLTNPRFEKAMKSSLQDEMTETVHGHISGKIRGAFESRFKDGLSGKVESWSKQIPKMVKDRAARLGQNVDQVVDDVVKAGWEGVDSGIKIATRSTIRAGLDEAFVKLRGAQGSKARPKPKPMLPLNPTERRAASPEALEQSAGPTNEPSEIVAGIGNQAERKQEEVVASQPHEVKVIRQVTEDPSGNVFQVVTSIKDGMVVDQDKVLLSSGQAGPKHETNHNEEPQRGNYVLGANNSSGGGGPVKGNSLV